ncbi:MAG: BlaI/MecI/CopY family transcriptional regulator [Defluviitaleaceae bacterium]|nr:BlaI/MecI/CopY family transcriptional regulator [Defluviitaleaceae bacterium]
MRLTNKEMEIMVVLWGSEDALTAAEIIELSENRTWKDASIYIIMTTLLKKGAVIMPHHKPTATNTARAYKPLVTSEEYISRTVAALMKKGVKVSIPILVEKLSDKKAMRKRSK